MNFELPETDCYGMVWFAVLLQAIEDATVVVEDVKPLTEMHYYQRKAILWFKNRERKDVGSFTWVCSVLNLEPEDVLEKVRERRQQSRRRVSLEGAA